MSILKSIRITRVNDDLTIPSNPVVVDLCVESLDLKKNVKYNDVNCLLSKTPSKEKGGDEPSGTFTINFTKQSIGLIANLFMGDAYASEDLTSDSWAADTVMAVGDVVNHSDGKHSMVVKRITGDGKTGSDEPTITAVGNETQLIEDNNVVWEAMPLLKKFAFKFEDKAPLFIIEYGIDDETGNGIFYRQFNGCEISTFPLKADVDDKSPSMQVNVVAQKVTDSVEPDWQGDLASIGGAKLVTLTKDYYSARDDDKIVSINGNTACVDSLELTIDKGLKTVRKLGGCATKADREVKADGKITLDFTVEEYKKYKNEDAFNLDVKFVDNGVYALFSFEDVKAEETDPNIQSRTNVMLEPNIWVEGDDVIKAEIAQPVFIDSNGDIVSF